MVHRLEINLGYLSEVISLPCSEDQGPLGAQLTSAHV